MIKANVGFFKESVNPLPGYVQALFCIVCKLRDPRIACDNVLVTSHADINAWNAGHGAFVHAGMTVVAVQAHIGSVDHVREFKWLLWLRPDAQKMPGSVCD